MWWICRRSCTKWWRPTVTPASWKCPPHALALHRVAGIEYDTAVLTNITQDHLDFHKTMENYREAKALLFTHLHEGVKPNKTAIFNADDPSSALIMPRVKTKIMTYGKGKDNDVYPLTFHVAATHMELNPPYAGG